MQFKARSESWGSENQTWLGSSHATDNCQTVTLDGSKFTGVAVDGVIPSGTPLKANADGTKFEPVSAAGDTLAGFLFTSQTFDGVNDVIAPMLDHGRILAAKLPGEFDITTLTTASPHFVVVAAADAEGAGA